MRRLSQECNKGGADGEDVGAGEGLYLAAQLVGDIDVMVSQGRGWTRGGRRGRQQGRCRV